MPPKGRPKLLKIPKCFSHFCLVRNLDITDIEEFKRNVANCIRCKCKKDCISASQIAEMASVRQVLSGLLTVLTMPRKEQVKPQKTEVPKGEKEG